MNFDGHVLGFADNVPLEKAHHRVHGPDESANNIERCSVADFVSDKHGVVTECNQDWLHALEELFRARIQPGRAKMCDGMCTACAEDDAIPTYMRATGSPVSAIADCGSLHLTTRVSQPTIS